MASQPSFQNSKPAEASLLARLETRLGSLPSDYRAFLLAVNGGHPDPSCLYLPDGTWLDVRHLFGLKRGSHLDLEAAISTYESRVPAGLLPIGGDSCGNIFVLAIATAEVIFWDHELEAPEGSPPTTANLTPVAPSFSAFLQRFVACPSPPEVRVVSAWINPKFLEEQKRKGNAT